MENRKPAEGRGSSISASPHMHKLQRSPISVFLTGENCCIAIRLPIPTVMQKYILKMNY